MSVPEPFDFTAECIKAYHDAGDDLELRIKVLSLLKNVPGIGKGVKSDPDEGSREDAMAVLRKLNGNRA